jgi:exonuclease III
MTCFKFATLNINGLHSETRIGMLREFVRSQDLQITNLNKLPLGRGMTADFRGVKLLNIYAPSGTAKNEKESKIAR